MTVQDDLMFHEFSFSTLEKLNEIIFIFSYRDELLFKYLCLGKRNVSKIITCITLKN